jgi:hypothetical protein
MGPRSPSPPRRLAATLAVVASALLGCGGGQTLRTAQQAGSDDGGSPLQIGGSGEDAPAGSLDVAVSPAAPHVCPGQCVGLTAVASGGTAPYTYRWTAGLSVSSATELVCPDQTTAYTVVATDSSGRSGELPRPAMRGTASVTVAEGACSADGGPLVGQDASDLADSPSSSPLPSTPLVVKCSASWPSNAPDNGGPGIRADVGAVALAANGDIVVGASFVKSIAIGGQTLDSLGDDDLIVVRLDAQCNVLWTKQVGGYASDVSVTAVAVDPSGNAIVAGYFQTPESNDLPFGAGQVDFGTGAQSAPSIAGFVAKIDTTGKTTWAKVYGGDSNGGSYVAVLDLAADGAGDALAVVRSDAAIDFGSGPMSNADGGTSEDYYLVRLDPSGALVSALPSESFASSSWLIDSVDAAADGTVWLGGTGWFDSFANGQAGSSKLYAVHASGSGAVLSSQVMPAPSQQAWNGAAVRVGPSGDAVVSGAWAADNSGLSWGRWLEGLSASGDVGWTYPSLASYGSAWDPAEVVRLGARGHTWLASDFEGSLALGPPVGTLSAGAGIAAYVIALDAAGNAVSGSVPPSLTDSVVGDLALDANEDVFLTGWSGSSPNGALFVTKLGF